MVKAENRLSDVKEQTQGHPDVKLSTGAERRSCSCPTPCSFHNTQWPELVGSSLDVQEVEGEMCACVWR